MREEQGVSGSRRNQRDRVRLSDVAERAGVSPITVSRALRSPGKVSEELRQTILHLVEEMGYTPDLAARALASRHSGVVGVITPSLNQLAFSSVMTGIDDRMRLTDLHVQYANTADGAVNEVRQTRAFLAYNPAGIILAGAEYSDELSSVLQQAICPVVHITDTSRQSNWPAVGSSFMGAGVEAVRFLVSRGYRRIGIVGGHLRPDVRSQLEADDVLMRDVRFFEEQSTPIHQPIAGVARGGMGLAQLLDQAGDLDAALCFNDEMALGALFECQRRGIRVPEDFGICGICDLDFAALTVPALTTVRLPLHEFGFRAADLLVRALQGTGSAGDDIDLGFTVVPRGTTR